ncbi:hypothetical protein EXIGLDRAFT_721355 [Exidia glandulosa HHB12029]|uniref:F-box domain-containing protein n=1 Tax=Exidia glandulosa HHB12029 TaxID=1314781 RepID=A0A166BFH5_EXIGL|nr:hypothetical protein EXIGLDRAFT_721355 [Exidia glandulosa HHB12029]
MANTLPVELVRDILELSARNAAAQDLPWVAQLALICRGVYEWIYPVLYETVGIDERTQDAFFALVEQKPASFFGVVRHLMLLWAIPPGVLQQRFLDAFHHVQRFTAHMRGLRFMTRAAGFRPTRLVLTSSSTEPVNDALHSITVLQYVTHLHVREDHGFYSVHWDEISTLMPLLSHIRIDADASWRDSTTVLRTQVTSILQLPSCRRVVVRYSVHSLSLWKELVAALQSLGDARIYVYRPTRAERQLRDSPAGWLAHFVAEARAGVDPWIIGRPVYKAPDP